MDDIDRLLDEILKTVRTRTSTTFSTRSYGDQPLIQTGKQYRESYHNTHAGRAGKTSASRPSGNPTSSQPRQGTLDLDDRVPSGGRAAAQPARPQRRDPRPRERAGMDTIPERYYELRRLAQSQGNMGTTSMQGLLAYGSRSASKIFYEQARLMEDFEDDFPFEGSFFQYYPTYDTMSLTQLRGYFSWRTRVRKGEVGRAPASFAFLYLYELLCGIGTVPGEQGYRDIDRFRQDYLATNDGTLGSFSIYARIWLRDYAVYHGLDAGLVRTATGELPLAVHVLLRAEQAALEADGRARRLAQRGGPSLGSAPSDEELLGALDVCSSYRISGSRLRRDHMDELRAVSCAVFRALCVHCGRRRKTDYVEGLFGMPYDEFYVMFSSAVFYDPEPHPDTVFEISPVESFACRDGRWTHHMSCDARSSSRELGRVLRATDQRLRGALDYPYPLKERPVQAYVAKLIDKAIADELERRREEERRRIKIDLSALDGIRAAAATTQEALLTEEEREDVAVGLAAESVGSAGETDRSDQSAAPEAVAQKALAAELPTEAPSGTDDAPSATSPGETGEGGLLDEVELRVLRALLAGETAASALGPGDPLLSLVIDAINDKLFEVVGDAVIEFVSDEPAIIEDYLPDIQEALGL